MTRPLTATKSEAQRSKCDGQCTGERACDAQMVRDNARMHHHAIYGLSHHYAQSATHRANKAVRCRCWIHEAVSSRRHGCRSGTVSSGGQAKYGVEDAGFGAIPVPE